MDSIEDKIADKIIQFVNSLLAKIIKPDMTVQTVGDLDEAELERIKQETGIEGVILDVDETIRKNMRMIPKVNQQWLETLKGKLKVVILTNGRDEKIEQYFEKNRN